MRGGGFADGTHRPVGRDHSPEAWAKSVVNRIWPLSWSMVVVWTMAISCWPRLLRMVSSPLASEAQRKVRSPRAGMASGWWQPAPPALDLGARRQTTEPSRHWTQCQNFFSAVIFDQIEAGVVNTREQQEEVIDLFRGFRPQVLWSVRLAFLPRRKSAWTKQMSSETQDEFEAISRRALIRSRS